ncbi:coil containing protein [Vibrio phage 1.225.O._10N.261.48.B7]|nr:coil containing protein [Vibrio phage 1.225.O._10N.261.48.B7]
MTTALVRLADAQGVSPEEIKNVLSGMIISAKAQHGATASDAELTVVSSICSQYGLNPLAREAHAFVSGGKLSVTIGVDGWIKIMNRQPDFDGVEFDDNFDGKELVSVTTKIYIKGRKFPTCVTEYMDECYQAKSPAWQKFKKRMLRNKSLGQCVRVAFGISEVIDSDEADRIKESEPAQARDITPKTEAVNIEKIEHEIAQAGDLDTLKSICGGIRKDLEARGLWEQHKSTIVKLNEDQKARIASFDDVEEAEFEEVVAVRVTSDNIDELIGGKEPDIAFEDEEEEL